MPEIRCPLWVRDCVGRGLAGLAVLLIGAPIALGQSASDRPQGWSALEARDFAHLSLGSELFPLSWAQALQSASANRPFLQGLDRHGFLADPDHPDGLAVGLSAAPGKFDAPTRMLGMNCGACHITEVTWQGQMFRINGAPNVLIDLVGFNADLSESVAVLARDPREFAAFQLRLVESPEEQARLSRLRPRALVVLASLAKYDRQDTANRCRDGLATALQPLFAAEWWPLPGDVKGMPRLDRPVTAEFEVPLGAVKAAAAPAITAYLRSVTGPGRPLEVPPAGSAIEAAAQAKAAVHEVVDHLVETVWYLRRAASLMEKQHALRTVAGSTPAGPGRVDDFRLARNLIANNRALALPADSPTSIPTLWLTDRVKWLGWDANADSTMQRNIATAIAIGAATDPSTGASSIPPQDVYRLEVIGSKVPPPSWPFGGIDQAMAEQGAKLYQSLCVSCHVEVDDALGVDAVRPWLPDLLYDPAPADGKAPANADPATYVGTDPNRALNFANDRENRSNGSTLDEGLATLQKILYITGNVPPGEAERLLGNRTETWRTTRKYAGRPLRAVWAAAPYLHNDSVPTLCDLLKPAAERPSTFRRGGRAYDPVRMGYVEPPADDKTAFVFDTALPGNRNIGHEYGTDLDSQARDALLEYLKTR